MTWDWWSFLIGIASCLLLIVGGSFAAIFIGSWYLDRKEAKR